MGKRLIRIRSSSVSVQLPALLNQELNLILKNGVTLHGIVKKYGTQDLILEDMVGRRHATPLSEIEEIVLDQVSLY